MLSRSSSNAGDRLRRAKSTSSAHTSSSGHQRQTTCIDPFTSRHQAEAAAIEAYERARQTDEPAQRPRPQRRRSQRTGKSEGGHFEDARKRALARSSDDASRARQSQVQQAAASRPSTAASGEERVITRRRSVIPPLTDAGRTQVDERSSISTSDNRGRRRQSTLGDGSPAPRYSLTVQEQEPTLQLPGMPSARPDDHNSKLSGIAEFISTPGSRTQTPRHSRPSTREATQFSEEALDQARDRCLQDFQTKRVRERKSFILAPFQKRRTHKVGGNFDNSLPPFNYAESNDAAPLPQNTVAPPLAVKTEQKARNLSDTLKGRLKKVFRKTSKQVTGVPPQHVEAPEFHFTVRDTDLSEADDTFVDYADPFMTVAAEDPRPQKEARFDSTKTTSSSGDNNTIKSRVTSWTNSTVAGMSTIRTNNGPFTTAGDAGDSKPSDSLRTLRKASSFWGCPIQNKLRRTSKNDLKGSEESQGLYDALQKRIRPSRSMEPPGETTFAGFQEAPPSRKSSALATLPSQRDYSSSQASRASYTIRSVTPQDPAAQTVNVPSPVKENLSPEVDADLDDTVITYPIHDDSKNSTPQSDLKRRPAVKAQPPSQEQLSKRLERFQNRWKSPLDELSAQGSRPTKTSMMEDNPYELRSLRQAIRQTTPGTDLPHHTRVLDESHAVRADALSPSVYSRATDGASPRRLTPEDLGMTTITVTGREVRRYDISPPKPAQAGKRQASREWRRWLSDEMSNLGGGKNELDLVAEANVRPVAVAQESYHTAAARPRSNTASPECLSRPGSVSPAM
ncbi:hypothetical protein M409DRAFT_68598 [Zasmidium cellare ATCC 36951]|uniref:Uncharacterized protein n=1 Tax=Zasmidium cellare ATCC 36951 TaxID=1080233 RepID=A0A6A6C8G9_ZASCE|nr:uncharacterized protein M409DRAFT_68598 [Zasmidium cellare ATCC 36951]KAF2163331.1 hypothetical protein M409DRAFT_68598 [Zasmidium cellare ATCC 36951]